jgi:plasmid stability protein
MSKMIQIRNVPDEVHRRLKTKAAQRGMTLSDYLLEMAEREMRQVSIDEMLERLAQKPRRSVGTAVEDVIREARGPLPE